MGYSAVLASKSGTAKVSRIAQRCQEMSLFVADCTFTPSEIRAVLTEMEEVRANKNWMCPHCIEEKGIKRYWICNR
jgi:hypothetical protein